MDRILDQIRRAFAETTIGSAIELELGSLNYTAYVIRFSDSFGVAIPFGNSEQISERFHNARLHTEELGLQDKTIRSLLLTSTADELRMEFATLCADFVKIGEFGKQREELLANPLRWWDRWTHLLGNAITNKESYSVLGELLTLEYLLQSEQGDFRWGGSEFSIHDIEGEQGFYEVKSTVSRYSSTVEISSQFQLLAEESDVNLIFCRFEKSDSGDSIDAVVDRLIALGVDSALLETNLKAIKLEKGSSIRKRRYRLIEMRQYKVDKDFPLLRPNFFKQEQIPEFIIQLVYSIDLSGIPFSNLLEN